MGFENNIEMLSLAFWQVLKLAGPVLLVALAYRTYYRNYSSCYIYK